MKGNQDLVAATVVLEQTTRRVVAYSPVFARLLGSVTAGIMLSQAMYWDEHTTHEDGWFWKTQAEWEQETALSRYEQESARKKLRQFPFWEEDLRGVPAKLWFRVDKTLLTAAILEYTENPQTGKQRKTQEAETPHTSMRESRILESGNPATLQGPIPQANTESTTKSTSESVERVVSAIAGGDPSITAPAARNGKEVSLDRDNRELDDSRLAEEGGPIGAGPYENNGIADATSDNGAEDLPGAASAPSSDSEAEPSSDGAPLLDPRIRLHDPQTGPRPTGRAKAGKGAPQAGSRLASETQKPVPMPVRGGRPPSMDVRKIGRDGLIPRRKGTTPVEVLREYVPAKAGSELYPSVREALMEQITDLDKWRWVLHESALRGFNERNIRDRLDVYHNGFKDGTTYEQKGRSTDGSGGEASGDGWEWDEYGVCTRYPKGKQPVFRGYAKRFTEAVMAIGPRGREEAERMAKAVNREFGYDEYFQPPGSMYTMW